MSVRRIGTWTAVAVLTVLSAVSGPAGAGQSGSGLTTVADIPAGGR